MYFCNEKLEWVDKYKYLGTVIDSGLNFNEQRKEVCNKISRGVGIIYRMKDYLPRNVMLYIYYSLIYSHLIQSIIFWGGVSTNKMKPLHVAINKVLRNILGIRFNYLDIIRVSTDEMYYSLQLLKVHDIYKYSVILFFHSILYYDKRNIFNQYFSQYLPQHNYSTRNSRMNLPPIELEIERQSTIFNCISVYNDLPTELIGPQSKFQLKKKIKTWLLSFYNQTQAII